MKVVENYIDIEACANYLNLSKVTLYRWSKAGKIPAVKIGKCWRYDLNKIAKWVKQR